MNRYTENQIIADHRIHTHIITEGIPGPVGLPRWRFGLVGMSAAVGQIGTHFPFGQTLASKSKVRRGMLGAAGRGWIGGFLGISN
jgi:hypothetical protein